MGIVSPPQKRGKIMKLIIVVSVFPKVSYISMRPVNPYLLV
jgi:hypothetical protein